MVEKTYSSDATCVPNCGGCDAALSGAAHSRAALNPAPFKRLVHASTSWRSPVVHPQFILCVAKLYPITAYYSLLLPITAKQHSREKYSRSTGLNDASQNHKPLSTSRLPQFKTQNSAFKIYEKT
jgi:hypothetical protein